MKHPHSMTSRIMVLSLFLTSVPGLASVFAQARGADATVSPKASSRENVAIKRIEGIGVAGMIKTPRYMVDTTEANKVFRQWARVSVQYTTKNDWTDELEFRYFVLVRNRRAKEQTNPYVLFTATVTYMDIQKGAHTSTMFLRPSVVTRYGSVEQIAVEIWSGGEQKAVACDPKAKQPWWQQITGKVKSVSGVLLNRSQTPFVFVGYDDHEMIKAK